jgi:hypothetical protein
LGGGDAGAGAGSAGVFAGGTVVGDSGALGVGRVTTVPLSGR